MKKQDYIEKYGLEAYNVRLERRRKWYVENREKHLVYNKKWNKDNQERYNENKKKYKKQELNSFGKPKDYIRFQSNYILFKQLKHAKLTDYEIHHCYSYDDPTKFIYIPRFLHLQIHKFLRDNNIDAASNHWGLIKDMVNACDQYTYISC